MIHQVSVRNVHEALPEGMRLLEDYGVREDTRNGPCLVLPGPVMTTYKRPWERVLFWKQRNANPFFHLFESLWMLAGRNDVDSVAYFNSGMRDYSDDGVSLHGAYGHRWRNHFQMDQLLRIEKNLRDNPTTRRAVLQMWNANKDLQVGDLAKDLPCNTQIYFSIHDDALHMTVTNRSNDIIWGLYGANAAHMSMLQEYLATRLGVDVGPMYTLSNNFHAYADKYEELAPMAIAAKDPYRTVPSSPYEAGTVESTPLENNIGDFDAELQLIVDEPFADIDYHSPFLRDVAGPMFWAWRRYKQDKDFAEGYEVLYRDKYCQKYDWIVAGIEWLHRREVEYERAKDDGPAYS